MRISSSRKLFSGLSGLIGDRKALVGGKIRRRLSKEVQEQLAARLDLGDGGDRRRTLDELAILRQTRGQRSVGELVIPVELRAPIQIGSSANVEDRNSDTGVETRANIPPGRSE